MLSLLAPSVCALLDINCIFVLKTRNLPALGIGKLEIYLIVYSLLRVEWVSGDRNNVCAHRLLLPANLIMDFYFLSTKNLMLSSLTTPQLKATMASSQGLTFLSGAATLAALRFYSPSQNPAVEPYAHYNDGISDFDLHLP